ncbi:glycosyltransferase family 4 protein [Ruminococcaceae bacterium OttesenSCG-928-A16]|nr:glycosyltransferase family 4 protein [Ruminococcaceae bacterium OttesenSCG-928-A16]
MPNSNLNQTNSASMGKKRLLVVSQHFWPENFRITDIVAGFTANSIEVDVLCGLPNYPKGEWFDGYKYTGPRRQTHVGAQIFRAGEIRRKGNTSLRIFLNYVSFPFFALFSLPRLAGRKYDAVFCYETSPVLMMLPAIVYAKTHRVPLTTYVLDLWPDNLYSVLPIKNKLARGLASGVSNWFYRRSPRLIAMSDKLATHLQTVTAKKAPAIAVIPQYCEDFYAQDIEDKELQQRFAGHFNILFTGNISPAQDLDNLVKAMQLVNETEPTTNIQCLIVGDGMSKTQLKEIIAAHGVQKYFVFCGQQPATDIPKWTGIASALFAGLAKSDNLSLTVPAKITSYFAAGRPMLVAADAEAARVAEESGAALVSPAGDAQKLAQNILALYHKTPAARTAMGAAGRQCYQKNYKRSNLLAQLKQFIFNE